MRTGETTKSVILEKGFGFCLGKGEKYTRVFISSVNTAEDLFSGGEGAGVIQVCMHVHAPGARPRFPM